jgi:rubrerythrin
MRDVDTDPDDESQYECFDCGTIFVAADSPGRCPGCGGRLRNRQVPLE